MLDGSITLNLLEMGLYQDFHITDRKAIVTSDPIAHELLIVLIGNMKEKKNMQARLECLKILERL